MCNRKIATKEKCPFHVTSTASRHTMIDIYMQYCINPKIVQP